MPVESIDKKYFSLSEIYFTALHERCRTPCRIVRSFRSSQSLNREGLGMDRSIRSCLLQLSAVEQARTDAASDTVSRPKKSRHFIGAALPVRPRENRRSEEETWGSATAFLRHHE